jgi:hypothetical protein
MVEENEPAVCGFDFVLVDGYEYFLDSDHSLTDYFRVYEVDPYCDWDCNLWYDAFSYYMSDAPCGRDENFAPVPCGADTYIPEWVFNGGGEGERTVASTQLGETRAKDQKCLPPNASAPQSVNGINYSKVPVAIPPGATAWGATQPQPWDVDVTAYYDGNSNKWKVKVTKDRRKNNFTDWVRWCSSTWAG